MNYYELLSIPPDIETENIKPYAKQKLAQIEKDKTLSKDDKKKKKNLVKTALKTLGKYKTRKAYDDSLGGLARSFGLPDLDEISKQMSSSMVPFDSKTVSPFSSQMHMMMRNMDGEQTVYSLKKSGDKTNQKEIYDKYTIDKHGKKKKQIMTDDEMEKLRKMQTPNKLFERLLGGGDHFFRDNFANEFFPSLPMSESRIPENKTMLSYDNRITNS